MARYINGWVVTRMICHAYQPIAIINHDPSMAGVASSGGSTRRRVALVATRVLVVAIVLSPPGGILSQLYALVFSEESLVIAEIFGIPPPRRILS
jgi:hypothetical protein